jgi:hypothetical protein
MISDPIAARDAAYADAYSKIAMNVRTEVESALKRTVDSMRDSTNPDLGTTEELQSMAKVIWLTLYPAYGKTGSRPREHWVSVYSTAG